METALVIWMIGTLPTVGVLFFAVGAIVFISAAFAHIPIYVEKAETYKKPVKNLAIGSFLLMLFGAIIPDKETTYAMAAGAIGQKIVESPKAQELGSDAVDVLSAYLKKTKKELEGEK